VSSRIFLHGALASHRRGRVLRDSVAASNAQELPPGGVVVVFGEDFQSACPDEQSCLIGWTRTSGRVLLLVPPFSTAQCELPVPWRAERLSGPPRGGEGFTKLLTQEVGYRLTGSLQAPAIAGATWSDLSVCVGVYRLHPSAGLFVVTCLPIWSLAVLDAATELENWLKLLISLAGPPAEERAAEPKPLEADHFGLLVFLLAQPLESEEEMLVALRRSSIFQFASDHARSILHNLQERGLVVGAAPTQEAGDLVMSSPYAAYVAAVRQVS
jgi:hypothetical protein